MITRFEDIHHYNVKQSFTGREHIHETIDGYQGPVIADVWTAYELETMKERGAGYEYIGPIAACAPGEYRVYLLYTTGHHTVAIPAYTGK